MKELLSSGPDLLIPDLQDNLPHVHIDTGWAIDVDRTLSSVDAGLQRLASIGETYGVPGNQLFKSYRQAKDAKLKFDPLEMYRAQLHPTAYEELCAKFSNPGPESIVYSDVPRFLGRITGPNIILTYAQHVPFQRIKLRSLPYQGYAHVIEHTNKGPLIESWRTEAGTFDFVGLSERGKPLAIYNVARVNLIDDNDQSHKDLPPESTGYYLRRPHEKNIVVPSSGTSENVVTISSLDEISETGRPHNLPPLLEQPFAYVPLNEANQPLLWLGHTLVTSLTKEELESSRAA